MHPEAALKHAQDAAATEDAVQAAAATPSPWPQRKAAFKAFVIKNWLPIVFAVAITLALAWPVPGRYLTTIKVAGDIPIIQEVIMGTVFFISGLTLDTQDLKKAVGAGKYGTIYGVLAILFITPCWGFVLRNLPLDPKLLTIGLVIFCVAPTTLGVGIALVHSCKGNDGLAKLLTVTTNLLGVVTMPIMLKFLFLNYDLSGLSVTVNLVSMLIKLAITILAPSLLGKLLRDTWPALKALAVANKVPLSMLSTFGLAFVMWQVLSSARTRLFASSATSIVSMIFITISIYVFYLAFNAAVLLWGFRSMPLPEAVAIIILASQKSAPVAVTLITYVTHDPVEQGLLALPALVGQLTQIFLGSAMAPPIAKRVEKWKADHAAKADLQAPALQHVELPVKAETETESEQHTEIRGSDRA